MSAPIPYRGLLVETFRPFAEAGVSHPDDLSLQDPAVISANELLFAWVEMNPVLVPTNRDEALLYGEREVSRSTLYFDAGFRDPQHLEEVDVWLDIEERQARRWELTEFAESIAAKRTEIRAAMPSAPSP